MKPLITKEQIGRVVNLSANISNQDIDSFILDAQEFDTIDVLPVALLTAIETNILAKIQQWNKNRAYSADDIVLLDTYFTAIDSNTDSQPPSAHWETNELMNFYQQYLVPFISYSFYYRFIAYHGSKVTQAGVIEVTDGTFNHISDAGRSRMLGDIKSKVNVWTGKISKKLNDVNWTFDGIKYSQDNGKNQVIKRGVRIYALGSNTRRSKFDRNCPPFLNHDIE